MWLEQASLTEESWKFLGIPIRFVYISGKYSVFAYSDSEKGLFLYINQIFSVRLVSGICIIYALAVSGINICFMIRIMLGIDVFDMLFVYLSKNEP